ncbi:MAG: hypothetical protein OHK0038_01320 [Flammeovirgaceae bacterium]
MTNQTKIKLGIRGIKGRLLLSFSLFTIVLTIIFLIFFWSQKQEERIKIIGDRLKGIKLKIEKANNLQKDFFIEESVNPDFYESRKSKILEEQKIVFSEIRETLHDIRQEPYFQQENSAQLLENVLTQINHFEIVFDSLVFITLERGYKSYGYEGEMRRALGSIVNSGYPLDPIREMNLRRLEKDYFIHRDDRYVELLNKAADTLSLESQIKIKDYYGRVFLEDAFKRYKEAFQKIVVTDHTIGFHGEPGLRESLNKLSYEIENELQKLDEESAKIFEEIAAKLRVILIMLFIIFIFMNLILGIFLFRSISSPIRKLSYSIHQVVESNFQNKHIFSPKRKDEIALLAQDFKYAFDKIEERTQQIVEQNKQISQAYENIKLLRQIGQMITKHLSVNKIIDIFFENVIHLVDVQTAFVGIYDKHLLALKIKGYKRDKSEVLLISNLEDKNKIGVWCYLEQKTIISNDFQLDLEKELKGKKPIMEGDWIGSAIYLPLTSKENKIGILSIQSNKKNAYSDLDINLIQGLSVYLLSALENALIVENLEEVVKERTSEITEQKNEIESQKTALEYAFTELEHKNIQLTSSINYAKRIQQAILPNLTLIQQALPQSFVFFSPRDIVSGDFYWFKEIKETQEIIIAAIDCTGHGVPGAFMSMIANEVLFNIVSIKAIKSPSEILRNMHNSIRTALKQEQNDSKDGMDVAICNIQTNKHELQFAGAKSPLIYIQRRKNNSVPEMIIINGDKHPVGGQLLKEKKGEERFFKQVSISLKEEDIQDTTFYMFSDGYQDQFGGEEEIPKKFMATRFRSLLLGIVHKDLKEQEKNLEKVLQSWKKDLRQTDDILVIGFRITNK